MITGGVPPTVAFGGDSLTLVGDNEPEIVSDGTEVDFESNADESARKIFTHAPWSVTGITVQADTDIVDRLNAKKNSEEDEDFSLQLADGKLYVGIGCPTGTIKYNPTKGTASFEAKGPGKLKAV